MTFYLKLNQTIQALHPPEGMLVMGILGQFLSGQLKYIWSDKRKR